MGGSRRCSSRRLRPCRRYGSRLRYRRLTGCSPSGSPRCSFRPRCLTTRRCWTMTRTTYTGLPVCRRRSETPCCTETGTASPGKYSRNGGMTGSITETTSRHTSSNHSASRKAGMCGGRWTGATRGPSPWAGTPWIRTGGFTASGSCTDARERPMRA